MAPMQNRRLRAARDQSGHCLGRERGDGRWDAEEMNHRRTLEAERVAVLLRGAGLFLTDTKYAGNYTAT